jgi:hypothetical protein
VSDQVSHPYKTTGKIIYDDKYIGVVRAVASNKGREIFISSYAEGGN